MIAHKYRGEGSAEDFNISVIFVEKSLCCFSKGSVCLFFNDHNRVT